MKTANELLKDGYYLTDGGLETTLIFHEGIELKHFAAFELLNEPGGTEVLTKYYQKYLELAKDLIQILFLTRLPGEQTLIGVTSLDIQQRKSVR
jgi:S-methylmethionine-dependent homocysteine/selenocysteine methylase